MVSINDVQSRADADDVANVGVNAHDAYLVVFDEASSVELGARRRHEPHLDHGATGLAIRRRHIATAADDVAEAPNATFGGVVHRHRTATAATRPALTSEAIFAYADALISVVFVASLMA